MRRSGPMASARSTRKVVMKTKKRTTTAAPTKTIPPELRDAIYDYLDPMDSLSFWTLRSLSRTSTADRALSLHHFFRSIVVYDHEAPVYQEFTQTLDQIKQLGMRMGRGIYNVEEPEEANEGEGDHEWDITVDRGAKRLYKLLKAKADLAKLPTELVFYGGFASERASIVVERFLKLCPNISTVRLLGMERPIGTMRGDYGYDEEVEVFDALTVLAGYKERLRCLAVERAKDYNLYHVFELVGRLSSLKSLSVSTIVEDEGRDIEFQGEQEPLTFQLESFELNALVEPDLFTHLVSTSLATLTHLSIALHRNSFDLSSLTSLTSLAIVYRKGRVVGETLDTAPSSVRSVELRSDDMIAGGGIWRRRRDWGSSDEEEDADDYEARQAAREAREAEEKRQNSFAVLLTHLPSQITRLSLPFYPLLGPLLGLNNEENELGALLDALAKPDFLPNLTRLDIADQSKENRMMWEEEMTPEERRMYKDARDSLREACEARGIELGGRDQAWSEKKREEGKMMRAF